MLISCNNLSKKYGSKLALNDVSLSLQAGAPIALVGPNGAGKTTLFSLLCGYILPTSGTVDIMGHPPGSKALFGQVAALPQDAQLDPSLTIISQLTLFAQLQGLNSKQAKQEALRVLGLVDLAHVAEQKPHSLSHGMSKRVSIAQALIGSPKLVLLDEPTAGLDPANAKAVRELVQQQSTNTTFIISSHNLDELEKLCDQVLYLDQGQLGQSVSIQNELNDDYLTLSMQSCDNHQFIEKINMIAGVKSIDNKQANEFVIHYDQGINQQLEISLFNMFAENDWQYKALIKGRTLEDKLFS
ncbi:ABC transporter ATP-binding protein [Shewanella waksmanii]|uniref:ABC transporter ATP-binding protein n=1 Tax=Shewanella waksmanii TaxID=213783 RepID=UPI0037356F4D